VLCLWRFLGDSIDQGEGSMYKWLLLVQVLWYSIIVEGLPWEARSDTKVLTFDTIRERNPDAVRLRRRDPSSSTIDLAVANGLQAAVVCDMRTEMATRRKWLTIFDRTRTLSITSNSPLEHRRRRLKYSSIQGAMTWC
jgi:hypothetical protein